jgi:putative transcriptional regulator
MATKRKFKSDAFEAIHSSASAMHKVGVIDKATMRSFDASCLASPPPLKPQQSNGCDNVSAPASRSSPAI